VKPSSKQRLGWLAIGGSIRGVPHRLIADAASGSGMGATSIGVDLWLAVQADAAAGTYNDTITLAIASGP
jgi:hypothetical protein